MQQNRPVFTSDVVIKNNLSINATVVVPSDTTLPIGTLVISDDGGDTFVPLALDEWVQTDTYSQNDEVVYDGHKYKSLEDNNTSSITDDTMWQDMGWVDVNGVLCDILTSTNKGAILISGVVKGKNLANYKEMYKKQLFKNKIIIR